MGAWNWVSKSSCSRKAYSRDERWYIRACLQSDGTRYFFGLTYEILSSARPQKDASLIARLLEENDTAGGSADDVEIIKEVAATTYAGRPVFSDCQMTKLKNDT